MFYKVTQLSRAAGAGTMLVSYQNGISDLTILELIPTLVREKYLTSWTFIREALILNDVPPKMRKQMHLPSKRYPGSTTIAFKLLMIFVCDCHMRVIVKYLFFMLLYNQVLRKTDFQLNKTSADPQSVASLPSSLWLATCSINVWF